MIDVSAGPDADTDAGAEAEADEDTGEVPSVGCGMLPTERSSRLRLGNPKAVAMVCDTTLQAIDLATVQVAVWEIRIVGIC